MKNILYIVIPCYNEEAVLKETAFQVNNKLNLLIEKGKISPQSRIMFVNDGSKDKTWTIIHKLYSENPVFCGVNLSSNKGHQNALLAGLMTAMNYADFTISMDADLQDDINAIDKMVEKYLNGCDIVYGVRNSRKTDTFFKKFTAESFYRLMKILGVDIVFNHADFRLMSKRALMGLEQYKEVNLFLRGIVRLIGYKSDIVEYERKERFAGESKYPLNKMLSFAFDGITSFSIKPIRLIMYLGIFIFVISAFVLLYCIANKFLGYTVDGLNSLLASVWFLGGIILFSVGLIGEYIGKIYNETKQRPRYIIEQILLNRGNDNE